MTHASRTAAEQFFRTIARADPGILVEPIDVGTVFACHQYGKEIAVRRYSAVSITPTFDEGRTSDGTATFRFHDEAIMVSIRTINAVAASMGAFEIIGVAYEPVDIEDHPGIWWEYTFRTENGSNTTYTRRGTTEGE